MVLKFKYREWGFGPVVTMSVSHIGGPRIHSWLQIRILTQTPGDSSDGSRAGFLPPTEAVARSFCLSKSQQRWMGTCSSSLCLSLKQTHFLTNKLDTETCFRNQKTFKYTWNKLGNMKQWLQPQVSWNVNTDVSVVSIRNECTQE